MTLMKRHPKASVNFSPEDVIRIRREYEAGILQPRVLADLWRVSPETIRRVARGDTYRHVGNYNVKMETVPHPSAPTIPGEPSDEEISNSLKNLLEMRKKDEGEVK